MLEVRIQEIPPTASGHQAIIDKQFSKNLLCTLSTDLLQLHNFSTNMAILPQSLNQFSASRITMTNRACHPEIVCKNIGNSMKSIAPSERFSTHRSTQITNELVDRVQPLHRSDYVFFSIDAIGMVACLPFV